MEDKTNLGAIIIGALISIINGGGLIAWFMNAKERKLLQQLKASEDFMLKVGAVGKIQDMYDKMVAHVTQEREKSEIRMGQMEEEIKMLHVVITKQNDRCAACPNNLQKKKIKLKRRRNRR